jgi:hypothetical protein
MHVFLRSASLLLATTVAIGCSDNNNTVDGATPVTGFVATNLLSDQPTIAPHVDPSLVNAWGLAMDQQSFWIAGNGTGKILVVAPDGSPSKFSPAASALNPGEGITGIIANTTNGFMIGTSSNRAPAQVLVASENGQIFAINPTIAPTPQLVIDRGGAGATTRGSTCSTRAST